MTIRVSEQALFRQLDDGAIALNLDTGSYYALNEVGARMWALLVEGDSSAEVVETIVAEFEVTREQVEIDLSKLIKELEANGLIVKV